MFKFCVDKIEGITFIKVKDKEVTRVNKKLKNRYESAATISGTRKLHCFIPLSSETIKTKHVTESTNSKNVQITKKSTLELIHNIIYILIY